MVRLFLFYFVLICLIGNYKITPSFGQNIDTAIAKVRPQLFFKLNSRRSLVSGESISVRGFRIGADFNNKHHVGVGIFDSGLFGLEGGAKIDFFDISLSSSPLQVQVDMGYFAVFYEHVLYKSNKWYVSFDTQGGIGKAKKRFRNNNGVLLQTKELNKPLIETAFELKYRIVPWVSASAGIGYRYVLDRSDEVINEAFNSPIYVLKVRVSFSYFFKRMMSRPKRTKKHDSDNTAVLTF